MGFFNTFALVAAAVLAFMTFRGNSRSALVLECSAEVSVDNTCCSSDEQDVVSAEPDAEAHAEPLAF
jgi:hypothetical protein